jgi:BMFP domain-containing protein YqiC
MNRQATPAVACLSSAMPCDVPTCRQEWEHAITAEREERLAALARAEAAEHTASLHAAELAVLRPRVHDLEARLAAAHRHPVSP